MENATSDAPQGKPSRRVPLRTCVACRTTGGKRGLLRLVRLPQPKQRRSDEEATAPAQIMLDVTGKKAGRGAYVCATETCVENAIKRKQIERSLKATLNPETVEALRQAVTDLLNKT